MSLRIDQLISNCCSRGTLLHFGLGGAPFNKGLPYVVRDVFLYKEDFFR